MNVLVDTGVTYSYLPPAMVDSIAETFGSWFESGEYKVDCALRDQPGTFNFGFNNDQLVIRVSYYDFFLKLQDNTCSLGVQQGADDAILGNTFLRGTYSEWTLDNYELPLSDSMLTFFFFSFFFFKSFMTSRHTACGCRTTVTADRR